MSEEQKKESIKLNKPTGVNCTESSETTLTISWDAVERKFLFTVIIVRCNRLYSPLQRCSLRFMG